MRAINMEGVRGRINVPRHDDGSTTIDPLTPAQLAIVEVVDWTVIPDTQNVSMDVARNPSMTCLVRAESPLGLWLYSTAEWKPGARPVEWRDRVGDHEAVVVWDAREPDFDDPGSVPPFVPASDGRRMYLRASSEMVVEWPVEVGDRVFIELTEARSGQYVLADMDEYERNHPDEYARAIASAGGYTRMRENGIKWFMRHTMGDLARVTPSSRDAIAARQAEWMRERADARALAKAVVSQLRDEVLAELIRRARRDGRVT